MTLLHFAPNSSLGNGVYNLRTAVSSGTTGQYPVYCHMEKLGDCDVGGWTLVLKMDGDKVRLYVT